MKLVFVSNILNHHQVEFCTCLQREFDEFVFVATQDVETLGFQKAVDAEYVCHYYRAEEKEKAERMICEADVVIFGDCQLRLIEMRMRENKLSLIYSERLLKKGLWRRLHPRIRMNVEKTFLNNLQKPLYVLCASAYLPYDLSLFGFPTERCFQWGYFPQVERCDVEQIMEEKQKKEKPMLLWVGRTLDWKHPDDAIYVADALKRRGYTFELHMVGKGEMDEVLHKMIAKRNLEDCVFMHGAKTPDEVREYMKKADVFLFTSDFNEGWGAVLNEAMNSGCSVVASHAAGSTFYLMQDGVNGLVYKSGNRKMLLKQTERFLQDDEFRRACGAKAYETITGTWNSAVAAKQLRSWVDAHKNGEDVRFVHTEGPCAPSALIKNNIY